MIEPTELRIGNLFLYHPIGSGQIVDTVIALKIKSKRGWNRIKGIKSGWNQQTQCEPIVLTTEILLRSGFIKSPYSPNPNVTQYIYKTDFIYLLFGYINEGYAGFEEKAFYFSYATDAEGKKYGRAYGYVHQLQNLFFDLTRREITIILK